MINLLGLPCVLCHFTCLLHIYDIVMYIVNEVITDGLNGYFMVLPFIFGIVGEKNMSFAILFAKAHLTITLLMVFQKSF